MNKSLALRRPLPRQPVYLSYTVHPVRMMIRISLPSGLWLPT